MQDPVGQGQDGQMAFIQHGSKALLHSSEDFVECPKYKGFGEDMRRDGRDAARHLMVTNTLSLGSDPRNQRLNLRHKVGGAMSRFIPPPLICGLVVFGMTLYWLLWTQQHQVFVRLPSGLIPDIPPVLAAGFSSRLVDDQ